MRPTIELRPLSLKYLTICKIASRMHFCVMVYICTGKVERKQRYEGMENCTEQQCSVEKETHEGTAQKWPVLQPTRAGTFLRPD